MLHCWQPKHKYNLNCCQMGKSRKKKKKKALCQDLQPWKRTGSAWVAGKGLAPLLTSLPRQGFGKKRRRSCFQAAWSSGEGSRKEFEWVLGLWDGAGSGKGTFGKVEG